LGSREGFITPYPAGHGYNWNDGALEASVQETKRFWREHNQCEPVPGVMELPDTDTTDGSRAMKKV
jgi:hypothetical protein